MKNLLIWPSILYFSASIISVLVSFYICVIVVLSWKGAEVYFVDSVSDFLCWCNLLCWAWRGSTVASSRIEVQRNYSDSRCWDHRRIKNRRGIDRYCLLTLTSREAAILDRSSAPLSVISLAGAMKCQRIKSIITCWIQNRILRGFFCKHNTCRHDTGHMIPRILIFIVGLTVIEYFGMWYVMYDK